MNYYKPYFILIITILIFSCNNDQSRQSAPPNQRTFGRWYFADDPQSYVEINGTTYTEHLQKINASLTCDIFWKDSLHYELKVKKATGALKGSLKPGDKIQIEIRELTRQYYRLNLHFKGKPQCILFTRKQGYDGPTGRPC